MMNWNQLLSRKRLGEEHKNPLPDPSRSEFDKDYDRIIFSYPFRRLQDKTQVIPLPEHDFVHTRLTHSLEVSVVGRTLGKKAGDTILQKYPQLHESGYTSADFGSITAAACLAHDIGNPPFGHSGENALSEPFTGIQAARWNGKLTEKELYDLQHFEGNAQGFRILCSNKYPGIRLTYATLGAFMKYPCEGILPNRNKKLKSQKKYGFYQSEKEIAKLIATELGLIARHQGENLSWNRHPLVFLMEAADDICYLVIDLEDAARMKVITYEKYVELLSPVIGERFDADKLSRIRDFNEKIGVLRALAINTLIESCVDVFCRNEADMLNGNFDTALTDLIPQSKYLNIISSYSVEYIYNSPAVTEVQAAGFEILPGLTDIFLNALEDMSLNGKDASAKNKNAIRLLPYYKRITDVSSTYERMMELMDYLSGLTDQHALNLYRKLKGISIVR